jgi:HAD superfamily hydrolase (TIGR01509 family)
MVIGCASINVSLPGENAKRMLVKKKYLLFDNDGVLVDTEYWYYKATEKALSEVGIELPLDSYLQFMIIGKSNWELASAVGISDETIQQHKQNRDRYYQQYLRCENIEITGVTEILRQLSKRYQMAIVTTAKKVDFQLIHEKRPIIGFMDFVLASGDYEFSKPHPAPYLTALERFGGQKEEALVIEDSERGLRSAVAAGIDCAVVYNEFTQSHDFSAATYQLRTLRELPELLRSLM